MSFAPAPNVQNEAYLEKYWDLVAAIAWKEFKAHGRGALLVQNIEQPHEDVVFIPLTMLTANPLVHDFAAYVRAYDPRREIVAVFLRRGLVSAYKGAVAGRETPPEAYRRLSAVLW